MHLPIKLNITYRRIAQKNYSIKKRKQKIEHTLKKKIRDIFQQYDRIPRFIIKPGKSKKWYLIVYREEQRLTDSSISAIIRFYRKRKKGHHIVWGKLITETTSNLSSDLLLKKFWKEFTLWKKWEKLVKKPFKRKYSDDQ